MDETWEKAQEWEASWHGTAVNSFNEELKQLEYAKLMGLKTSPTHKTPYNFDLGGKSILDIGGGAYSLLLKCENFSKAVVVDPLMKKFPQWVRDRYEAHNLEHHDLPGEELLGKTIFDEVWFYNVLEHTYNPELICKNARKLGKAVRVFEWLDTPANIGHPQTLTEEKMDEWLGGKGKVQIIKRGGAVGKAYSGVFKGDSYEE